ncbi:hypothetical protein L6452_32312 [Arctium lappa]|uniref:Uncharacterized protein n=1 Tax=Arctium lappa TaxID=4217 RepID=A0ACB8Z467_ARCLA|nr:hypothetical protein L6452_32312 [Arctium lappa]
MRCSGMSSHRFSPVLTSSHQFSPVLTSSHQFSGLLVVGTTTSQPPESARRFLLLSSLTLTASKSLVQIYRQVSSG